ncbi:MAG: hypothetical protein RQ833_00225 [Sphingomonadaceae bacterium]|nr:hypothetical protein [Sphingomonadaceae bacterium]
MTIARTALLAAAVAAAAAAPAQADSRKTWSTVSDVGAGALAATALGLPIALGDKQGLFQAAGSMAVGAGAAELLSLGIREQRPDAAAMTAFRRATLRSRAQPQRRSRRDMAGRSASRRRSSPRSSRLAGSKAASTIGTTRSRAG